MGRFTARWSAFDGAARLRLPWVINVRCEACNLARFPQDDESRQRPGWSGVCDIRAHYKFSHSGMDQSMSQYSISASWVINIIGLRQVAGANISGSVPGHRPVSVFDTVANSKSTSRVDQPQQRRECPVHHDQLVS